MLLIPVILWNIAFTRHLPNAYSRDFFWHNIPAAIKISEKILRAFVFITPVFMTYSFDTSLNIAGFELYFTGLILYFVSWLVQMFRPYSRWSKSIWGFMAPAYVTIFCFIGIGLMSRCTIFDISNITAIYIVLSALFVTVHVIHTYIIFSRIDAGFY